MNKLVLMRTFLRAKAKTNCLDTISIQRIASSRIIQIEFLLDLW